MRRWMAVVVLLSGVCLTSLGQADRTPFVVYTYDSFASWGPASAIERAFEAMHPVDVQFVAVADSRLMLTRLLQERAAGRQGADVFIGIEAADLARVRELDLFLAIQSEDVPNLAAVDRSLLLDPTGSLVPYEHGYITFVYDSEQVETATLARTFEELLDPRYRNRIILEDPRMSSPGLSFLLWTIDRYGDPGYLEYWRRLAPNILTVAGGWGEAYDLFLAGEAPIVLSFSTDTAYSVIDHGSARHKVMLLENQGYRNVYFMGVVRGTDHLDWALAFLDLVLSTEIQSLIPTSEWMFPANPDALLPVPFYQYAVTPPRPVMVAPDDVKANLDRWLREWALVILGG
ncbi:thiamine ABC transporter substrate-binding protein [Candidatus Bipolaricaulota bacterium]|nr:thiamine ABC transporter substrate-binding protein [Candidatus Bipolaricaulota bacterium]